MKLRALLVLFGAGLMVYALRLLATGGTVTAPISSGKWLLGAALGHDLVLAPLVAAIGWLLARTVPARIRPVVLSGLIVLGAVTILAVPVLLDRGGGGNETTTPLDYRRGYLICLAVVIALTAGTAGVRAARNRRPAKDQDSSTS